MQQQLLEVNGLKKYFDIKGGVLGRKVGEVKAVDGISFDVQNGETLGIVGESGCGKSTTGKSILRLIEPTEGEVKFEGQDLLSLSPEQMRKMRRDIQIIFQDPYASLNPRHTVEKIIGERSEEHTSELQSRGHLVCRLLLEKKKEDDVTTKIIDNVESRDRTIYALG